MAFREKIAWTAFLSTLILWGGYFAAILAHARDDATHGLMFLWLFIGLVVIQAAIMAIVGVASAITAPRDARAPLDERDRSIAGRANSVAYYFVLFAIFAVIVGLHGWIDGYMAIFVLFGVIALAEAIRYGAQIVGYRSGGRG